MPTRHQGVGASVDSQVICVILEAQQTNPLYLSLQGWLGVDGETENSPYNRSAKGQSEVRGVF